MKFEEYIQEHGRALLRLAMVLTGDGHRAEDLTQAVLANALAQWPRVSSARSPHAYMRKMMVNAHLDLVRRRSSRESPMAPEDVDRFVGRASEVPDHAQAVADRVELRALVGQLSDKAQAALVLRFYEDLDDHAIGEVLGLRPGSVRSVISRALVNLRQASVHHKELL